jgi:hypothetical protein
VGTGRVVQHNVVGDQEKGRSHTGVTMERMKDSWHACIKKWSENPWQRTGIFPSFYLSFFLSNVN